MTNIQFFRMMDDIFGTESSRNIFRLEPERAITLRKRIASWNGLVRVFIHPLYERWRANGTPDSSRVEKGFSRLVQMPSSKMPPIIIFEEHEHIRHLSLLLKHQSPDIDSNCFVVETEPNNPTPFGYDEWPKVGWQTVTTMFVEFGIRRILMGGVRLEITSEADWTGKPPFMCRCVGIALSYLSNKKNGIFDVELSSFTDPCDARKLLKQ